MSARKSYTSEFAQLTDEQRDTALWVLGQLVREQCPPAPPVDIVDIDAKRQSAITVLTAVSDRGAAWIEANVAPAESHFLIDWVCEPLPVDWRAALDIVEGAQAAGLTVEWR